MTQLHMNAHVEPAATGWGLAVRLRPLFVASFLQSVGFWIPIEKLFMNVGEAVGRDSAAVRELLNEARGQVRAQLERYFDEKTT